MSKASKKAKEGRRRDVKRVPTVQPVHATRRAKTKAKMPAPKAKADIPSGVADSTASQQGVVQEIPATGQQPATAPTGADGGEVVPPAEVGSEPEAPAPRADGKPAEYDSWDDGNKRTYDENYAFLMSYYIDPATARILAKHSVDDGALFTEDLFKGITDEYLLAIDGIGTKRLAEIRSALPHLTDRRQELSQFWQLADYAEALRNAGIESLGDLQDNTDDDLKALGFTEDQISGINQFTYRRKQG